MITHDYYDACLTVGSLRKALRGLDDSVPVYYQRIEDAYFKKHGWSKTSVFLNDAWDGREEFTRAFCVVSTDQAPGFFITAHY